MQNLGYVSKKYEVSHKCLILKKMWKTNTDLIIIIPNGGFRAGQLLLLLLGLIGRVVDGKLFVDEDLMEDLLLVETSVVVLH